jgi:predicted secreted protein
MLADVLTKSPLRLEPDGTARITADGHGIGGYVWTAEVVEGTGSVEAEPPAVGSGIGGGSVATFKVRWTDPSVGKIRLHYRRPWEDEDAKTATIIISR